MFRRPLVRLLLLALCASPTGLLVAATTGITGGSQPFSNMQPSLAMNYIIRIQGDFNELGEVALFGGSFAPGGWAFPEGQLLAIDQNDALFNRIGVTYGGDGQTTFALPDLRGRTAIHIGQGPGLADRGLGEIVGVENSTLLVSQMPFHAHTLPAPIDTTSNTGGGQPFANMQPSLAMNYTIALNGIFPSQQGGGVTSPPYLANVRLFAGPFVPQGQAATNGQLLPISQNQALFSLLGANYGGNGQTTFALPDLRGRAVMHEGQGTGLTNRDLGEQVGAETITLSQAELPTHSHTLPPTSDTTGDTGGNQPHSTIQPSLALNYIIATSGIFPSRDGLNDETFLGEVSLFAGNFAPSGWVFADGQILPIAQNTALFSLLGTTYGGNGQTTFALPDLRGRVAIHSGHGPGLSDRTPGEQAGSENVTLSVVNLPPHTHEYIPEPASFIYAALALLLLASCTFRRPV